jgi:3-oxoacyl-[acyl-carrier protein] reductase
VDLKLAGAAVLVTGGTKGIGRSVARTYAEEAARVAVTYARDEVAAAATAAALRERSPESYAVRMDLGERASITAAVATVAERFGAIDVLVANAVRWPAGVGRFADVDAGAWEDALRTNLEGTAATVRSAWPLLAASERGGRIVLIGSGVTRHGAVATSAYATAKSALEGLASALKWEGAEAGILVNVVAPGLTVTEGNLERFPEEGRDRFRATTPSGRLSVADDVAPAVAFLGSPANANITGAYLPVAGGRD